MTTNQNHQEPNTPAARKAAPTNKAPRKPTRRAPAQPRSQEEAWELVGLAYWRLTGWCNYVGQHAGLTADECHTLRAAVWPEALKTAIRFRLGEPVTPELADAFGRSFPDRNSQLRKLAKSDAGECNGLSRTGQEALGDTIAAIEAGADPVEAAALAHQRRAHTDKPSQQAVRIASLAVDGRRPFVSLDAVMASSNSDWEPVATGHEAAVAKLQAERRALDAEAALKRLIKTYPALRRLRTAFRRGGPAMVAALAEIEHPTPELASLFAQVRAVITNEYPHLLAW